MSDNQNPQKTAVKSDDQLALEQYVEELIKEKNSPYVNKENFAEIKDMLLQEVVDAINQKMVSLLSDDQIKELNEMMGKNASDDEISQYFGKAIPKRELIVAEVLIDFRKGYLSVIMPPPEPGAKPPPAPVKLSKNPPIPISAGESGESTDFPPVISTSTRVN